MRNLVLRDLPRSVERAIKKKAFRKHLRFEEAAVELLQDAEIERAVQHDLAIIKRDWDFEEDPF